MMSAWVSVPILPFQQVTWKNDKCFNVPRAVVDADTLNALLALSGFQCQRCHKPLREEDGYACCSQAHCPYCGKPLDARGGCPHLVAHSNGHREKIVLPSDTELSRLLELTPPTTKLLSFRSGGHRRTGYPRWSANQWKSAYSSEVLPYLPMLFGKDLCTKSPLIAGCLICHCLQPDIVVNFARTSGTRFHYGFAQAPDAALAHLKKFLTDVDEGSQRLQRISPYALAD